MADSRIKKHEARRCALSDANCAEKEEHLCNAISVVPY